MDGNFFFVIGGLLVLAAVVIAFVGIRDSESFPPNRGVMVGVVALFAVIVGTTMAFAIVKANDEQKDRNEEMAKEEAQATGEAAPAEQPPAGGGGKQAPAAAETLAVASPADGSLVYQPNGLEAKPGNLTIDYDNPSQVPHSIAVATANGNVLGQTTPAAGGKQTLQLPDLAPGKYVFYCTVPGHREAGMEGDLTVGG
jgi:plastocyanin